MIRGAIDYLRSMRADLAEIRRSVTRVSNELGIHTGDLRVDETTPRLDCLSVASGPVLEPGIYPWMERSVYDARPVTVGNRHLAYFCGQPSYNTQAALVVGVAEWDDERYVPADRPCIYPTEEAHGIDIPTFCAHDGGVIGVYFDNYGAGRVADCRSRDLYICISNDGGTFAKRRVCTPLRDYPYGNLALPWLEEVDGTLYLTVRAKHRGRNIVSRALFDPDTGACADWRHGELSRVSVNVATVADGDRLYVFHGQTVAGGIYVSTLDAETLNRQGDVMLVAGEENPWGWGMTKICPSPMRRGNELTVLYTTSRGVGLAQLTIETLRAA